MYTSEYNESEREDEEEEESDDDGGVDGEEYDDDIMESESAQCFEEKYVYERSTI